MDNFTDLPFNDSILKAVAEEGYTQPTPIQAKAIPEILNDNDILGCAQTGTGKTAAFLLPLLHVIDRERQTGNKRTIKALVLTPTRELAAQIGDCFSRYAKYLNMKHLVIFGGVKQGSQVTQLRRGVDVLIATPGRLLDLHNQGYISFKDVSFFVLDEADRMLDMGFIHDIKKVLAMLPTDRQNLLFSATMPQNIVRLASSFLKHPVQIEVNSDSVTVEQIQQTVMYVEKSDKKRLLKHLINKLKCPSTIVFTRTKHGANRVVGFLVKAGIEAAAIHGNKSQNARTRALDGFKRGEVKVLVATDIASRGIDVDGVTHVFNFDIPNIAESYVHRIGRTGRAGMDGVAIAFCDESEAEYLWDIERLIEFQVKEDLDHEWHYPQAFEQMIIQRTHGKTNKKPSSKKGAKPKFHRRRQRGGRSNN